MSEQMHERLQRKVAALAAEQAAGQLRNAKAIFAAEPSDRAADYLVNAAATAFRRGILGRYEFGQVIGDVADWLCHERPAA